MEINDSHLERLHFLRKMCSIVEQHGNYILMFSTVGGSCGTFFFLDDPIKGFVIFAWSILIIYCLLIVAFSYNESLKKNCLLLLNNE